MLKDNTVFVGNKPVMNYVRTLYCATDTVTRRAMAAFIARAFLGMQ